MTLAAHTLMEQARKQAGLEDFGPAPLREGLERFCASLNGEANLHESGERQVANQIRGNLVQRLKVQDWCARHPEIDAETIARPIIVFGLPRSGTTALSQFLAQDPGLRSIRRWEAAEFTPPPETASERTDPRIEATRRAFEKRNKAMPELMSMVPVTAEDPSEHGGLLALTFRSLSLSGVFPVPSYERWAENCEMSGSYAYVAQVLKLLQWRCPPKRWNLKYPMDLYYLDTVRSVFPDAILVWCHRDPARCVPSVANLLYTYRAMVSDAVDKCALGRAELAQKLEGVARGMAFLDRHGEAAVFHLRNADLARDPLGTIRGLYERIGREFTPEFEAALNARRRERPRGKFGAHRYSAADFGLDEAAIRSAFGKYMNRFGIEAET